MILTSYPIDLTMFVTLTCCCPRPRSLTLRVTVQDLDGCWVLSCCVPSCAVLSCAVLAETSFGSPARTEACAGIARLCLSTNFFLVFVQTLPRPRLMLRPVLKCPVVCCPVLSCSRLTWLVCTVLLMPIVYIRAM